MCLARLKIRLQTSNKDGKAHFQNNINHKDHIQPVLTLTLHLSDNRQSSLNFASLEISRITV